MATAVVTARAQPLRRHDKRPNLPRVSTRATTVEAMDSSAPLKPLPHFFTEEYILDKHKNDPPSLIVHLHQNHFRFDQQDGNFPYESEAREFLRHLRERTVPGEPFLSEFYRADVPFRSGCLIVEVHNHRTKGASANGSTTNQVGATDHVPYSIHNYNEHITPSPFAKYPEHKSKAGAQQADGEKPAEKEPMSAPEQPASAMQKKGPSTPIISRRVLFPTQSMWDYDLMRLSMTPMTDARSDRHGSVQPGAATPTLGQPPTPITAMPTTPKPGQRMVVDASNAKEWEAEIINYTAPKLILNPAADLESSIKIIEQLEDPLHCEEPPLPKGRKRTVAEMAAEDAQAANMERYMLSSDERHQSMLSSGAAGAADGATRSGVSGEAQFKRFRLIEGLKMQQADNKRQEAEREAQRAAHKRQVQEAEARKAREAEIQEQQQAMQNRRQAEIMQRQQQINQQRAAAQAAAAQQAAASSNVQQMPTSAPQHAIQQTAQANQMSPIARQQTPMSGSPTIGGGTPMSSAQVTSVPMAASMSNQGAGSPPRPPSAVQHTAQGVNMMRQASQQASAHGTPQMHSTPSMASAAPVTRHMTPQPRVNQHGSPMPNQMQTPQMMNMTPVPNGMTPEQQQQLLMRQRMAQAQAQANQQSAMNGMSPQQMNQMMRMQSQMGNNPQQQQMNMTPQMMNQARMMQAQAANQAAAAAQQNPQMASINQALAQIMSGVPPAVAQRLMSVRQQGQTEIANQEQMRKQQFLTPYQQQGMNPPQEAIAQWQVNNQRLKMEAFQNLRQKMLMARQNLLQTFQTSMAQQQSQQGGGVGMSPQPSSGGNQTPGTPQGQMQQPGNPNPGNQAYMQQLMQQQRRLQAAQAAQAQAMQQAAAQQGGGGGQRMMQPGQGMAQMNPQMVAQMQTQMQMQGMNPAQQQAFMQQMRMQQMQSQGMNGMGMGGGQQGGFGGMNGMMQ